MIGGMAMAGAGHQGSTSPFADLARRKDTVWLAPVLEAEISYGQIDQPSQGR